MAMSMQEFLARRPRRDSRKHLTSDQRIIELEDDADVLEFEHLAVERKIDRMTGWMVKVVITAGSATVVGALNLVYFVLKNQIGG